MRSNFGKEFAFYIPHKFKEANDRKSIVEQLLFYWINGDELVTCTNSKNAWFRSDDDSFIVIDGMEI